MLFGVPGEQGRRRLAAPTTRTAIVNVALRRLRAELGDDIVLMADLCLDEYTDHGHCGVLAGDGVGRQRRRRWSATPRWRRPGRGRRPRGRPSGMMDGQVGAIRARARRAPGTPTSAILAYAAKYASGFYGPFREAAERAPQFGDRRRYQQDPRERPPRRCARSRWTSPRAPTLVMVKPALPYLDSLRAVADAVDVPVAAYQVSGEYAMVEAAARERLDRPRADDPRDADRRSAAPARGSILTYWAAEAAGLRLGSTNFG